MGIAPVARAHRPFVVGGLKCLRPIDIEHIGRTLPKHDGRAITGADWSHLENSNGPDTYGAAVSYIYRRFGTPKTPGGAEFVPELIHNHSGVGSAFDVIELNRDGVPDIATSGAYGTLVFLSKPGPDPAVPKK